MNQANTFAKAVRSPCACRLLTLTFSVEAVRQGLLGSCYFHASIAAIANRSPDKLRDAIREIQGGGYTVRFVDGSTETVNVDDVMFARENKFDLSDGLWVGILLRGLAQSTVRESLIAAIESTSLPASARMFATQIVRNNDLLLLAYDRAIRTTVGQDGTLNRETFKSALNRQVLALHISPFVSEPVVNFLDAQGFFDVLEKQVRQNGELFGVYRSAGQGGLPTHVLSAFDGPAHYVTLASSSDARKYLVQMRQDNAPIVAATGPEFDRLKILTQGDIPDWWVQQHAYTVLNYNPATDQVTLRNPWGTHPDPQGEFTLSTPDFAASFSYLVVMN
jgi:hypothetical protein